MLRVVLVVRIFLAIRRVQLCVAPSGYRLLSETLSVCCCVLCTAAQWMPVVVRATQCCCVLWTAAQWMPVIVRDTQRLLLCFMDSASPPPYPHPPHHPPGCRLLSEPLSVCCCVLWTAALWISVIVRATQRLLLCFHGQRPNGCRFLSEPLSVCCCVLCAEAQWMPVIVRVTQRVLLCFMDSGPMDTGYCQSHSACVAVFYGQRSPGYRLLSVPSSVSCCVLCIALARYRVLSEPPNVCSCVHRFLGYGYQ